MELFFKTALLYCNWRTINWIYLKYTVWRVLTYVYTCQTVTAIKVTTTSITPKQLLLLILPHHSQLQTTTGLLSVPIDKFSSSRFYLNEIIKHIFFYFFLYGFICSAKLFRFIHVVCINSSFFFYRWVIFHSSYIPQFIHSVINFHSSEFSGCLHFFFYYKQSCFKHSYLYEYSLSFLLGKFPGMGSLHYTLRVCLTL